jgi:DNA polymerase I
MRTLLIDCDSIVYIAAAANEVKTDWGDGTVTYNSNFDGARQRVDQDIARMQERLNADHVVLALSEHGDGPWRRKVLPSYKANRRDTHKPELIKPLRDYVTEVYTTYRKPGMEGDDCLGILATAAKPPSCVKGERVICAVDKDLMAVPGLHYNWRTDDAAEQEPTVVEVSEKQADRFHMTQTLTGDTADNYKGCPGIGPKKAEAILGDAQDVGTMWLQVVGAFINKGLTEQDALVQARVARICRVTDFDFKKREVRLWNPPKS